MDLDSYTDAQEFVALRISWWGGLVEEGPVGFPGVEEGADPVVLESFEAEGDAFHALIRLLIASVGPFETWE